MQRNYVLLGFIFFIGQFKIVIAQENVIGALKVGEKIPDIAINNIINYPRNTAKISDYKGKLLILDFWSIECAACVKAFPRHSLLQEKYGKRIQIMPVAFGNRRQDVIDLFKRLKSLGNNIDIPSGVFEDRKHNEFNQLFPDIGSGGFPLIAWIDTSGYLLALTRDSEVRELKIDSILDGKIVAFNVRHVDQNNFSFKKPFLIDGNGGPDSLFSYRSIISSYSPYISGYNFVHDKNARYTRLFIANQTISNLLYAALFHETNFEIYNKSIILEVKDPSRFLIDSDSISLSENKLYCYELILPPGFTMAEAYDYMLQDLCRYFKVTAQIQTRSSLCLIIGKENHFEKIITNGGKPFYFSSKNGQAITLSNRSFQTLLSFLNKRKDYPLIIDDTSFSGNIDVDITIPGKYDFNQLKEVMGKIDIEIAEEIRPVKKLIIADN